MEDGVTQISILGLGIVFVPVAIVIGIMAAWRAAPLTAAYASLRMLIQLLLIGYVLIYLFRSDDWRLIIGVISLMTLIASWIATRTLPQRSVRDYLTALLAIVVGGVGILAVVTQGVINVEPWFSPRYLVPLAGMTISGAMNAVSLAGERFTAERSRGVEPPEARRIAFQACLIPTVNSLFAVGLVSLPGMMTGQILSGVSPLIAAQYQIVVMAMLFAATGLGSAIFLRLRP